MDARQIEHWFAAGECIVRPGDPGDRLFVVHSGTVRVYPTEDDAPRLVSEGGMFGETAAILGKPYAFRAEAEGDVSVLAIEITLLNRLCRESDEFPLRLICHLADQLSRTQVDADSEVSRVRPKRRRGTPATADASKLFVRAILDSCTPGEMPAPVRGKLADLSGQAGVSIRDGYTCLQVLLDDRLVRLVDDQLAILEMEELEALAG